MSKSHEDSSRNKKTNVFTEDNSKLEWMYKSGSELLNREEYLLGKAIDKQFEQLDEEEKKQKVLPGVTVPKNHVEHECVPFSIRNYRAFQSDEQVDIQRKILEDPLMSIRQKEMESRRRILENPVKLKELHRLLKKEAEVNKSKNLKKKKKNKDKKHRKKKKKSKDKRASSSSSSSDDEDLDKLLAKKYRQIKEQFGANGGAINLKDILRKEVGKLSDDDKKHNRKRNASPSSDSNSSSSPEKRSKPSHKITERGRSNQDRKEKRSNYPQHVNARRCSSESSVDSRRGRDSSRKQNNFHRDFDKKSEIVDREKKTNFSGGSKVGPKHNSSREKRRQSSSDSSSEAESENEKPQKRNYGLITAAGEKIQLKGTSSKTSEISKSSRESAEQLKLIQQAPKVLHKPKLTAEEKERRYQEMMKNAEWREKERKTKVEKYRKEYERETNEVRNFDKNFINKEMHKAMTNQTSVESRLKSNINNIQRSGRAMDSNFAKR